MPSDDASITIQFLSKLDSIQSDVNKQGIRLERLNTIQETQTSTLSKITKDCERMSRDLPNSKDFDGMQREINKQRRQLDEQTGRWQILDQRKRTPAHGNPRSTIPPKRQPFSFKDFKDLGNIFRMISLVAVISAGVTAALATAGQVGWIGNKPVEHSEVLTPEQVKEVKKDSTDELLRQMQELQALFKNLEIPPGEASLSKTTEVVND